MAVELILIIILLLASGFFSSTELAFVVSNKLKIEIKARKNIFAAKNVYYFTSRPQDFFSTILIGNNIVNIGFASFATVLLSSYFGLNEFSILLISTFVLLIFGELLPKYYAREFADRMVLYSFIPVRALMFLLFPFVKVIASLSSMLTQSANVTEENIGYLFDKEDIELLVKESHEAGMVNKKESDIISKVFALGDQKVYEAMRPRTEIVGVEINNPMDTALEAFIESGYSKLPVYEENLDNIKGVIYAYDFFKFPESIKSIIREVIFVPDTKRSFDMLNEFLSKQVSIAVVIDEFGGTAGIVTMEDIIEELFGDIKDEYDVEENICRKIAPDTFIISGKVEIDHINEKYNLDIPLGDYETIAGYITSKIGRIPAQGENLSIDEFNILIIRSSLTKIEIVKLILKTEGDNLSKVIDK
jgi:CBS domain containing-hemolysin-like protein